MYICQGCKNAKHAGNAVVVESIGVSLDWSHFLTDPEALNHKCIELDYTYEYLAAEVGQGDLLERQIRRRPITPSCRSLLNSKSWMLLSYLLSFLVTSILRSALHSTFIRDIWLTGLLSSWSLVAIAQISIPASSNSAVWTWSWWTQKTNWSISQIHLIRTEQCLWRTCWRKYFSILFLTLGCLDIADMFVSWPATWTEVQWREL